MILITCDTLRAERLVLYGYDRPVSPRLDAFARDSVVFEKAYAAASLTGPALSSLSSGRTLVLGLRLSGATVAGSKPSPT